MSLWGAIFIAGFCGVVAFLVEIAPRLSRRRRRAAGTATTPMNNQHVQDEQKGVL